MNGNHMKYMLFGGIGLLAVALALGIQLQTALLVAFVLACPLMMMAMMGMANSDGAHAGHGAMGHASRATVTDPVCGMDVDPAAALAQRDYEGRTYYFCSQHCADAFAADPAKFTGTAIAD